MKSKQIVKLVPWGVVLLAMALLYFRGCGNSGNSEKITVTHNLIIEKIEQLGRLELVRYNIKDVMEYQEDIDWRLDPKVVLIVTGEAIGCIDLSKVDSSKLTIKPESITVTLPAPEICIFKVDHSKSKVYDVRNGLFQDAVFIDKAYKLAEENLKKAALQMGILEQTRKNAEQLLRPMLETFSGKKIVLRFEGDSASSPPVADTLNKPIQKK